jgi:hypothetical protein
MKKSPIFLTMILLLVGQFLYSQTTYTVISGLNICPPATSVNCTNSSPCQETQRNYQGDEIAIESVTFNSSEATFVIKK